MIFQTTVRQLKHWSGNMKDKDNTKVGRRNLLTNLSVTAVAGLAASAGAVSAQTQGQSAGFQPARHSKDAWLNEIAGDHRVFVDSSTLAGGANALRFASNIIKSHIEEYDGKSSDYAMVICFRHGSAVYGFGDAIWAKYGAILSRGIDPASTSNPMNTANAANGQNSIASMAEDGVRFAICKRSTRRLSISVAESTGVTPEEAFAELVAGAVPNSHFVAAGVLAATRAQEYSYSLLYAE